MISFVSLYPARHPTIIFLRHCDFDGTQQISGFNFLSINFRLRWIRQVALSCNGSVWRGALGTLRIYCYIGRVAYVPLCRDSRSHRQWFSELCRPFVKLVEWIHCGGVIRSASYYLLFNRFRKFGDCSVDWKLQLFVFVELYASMSMFWLVILCD